MQRIKAQPSHLQKFIWFYSINNNPKSGASFLKLAPFFRQKLLKYCKF